jgi:hypothetical protein
MSGDLPIQRIVHRGLQGVCRSLVLLAILEFLLVCPAGAEFDSTGWKHCRDILIPPHLTQGPIGISLESDVLELCRPDLSDIRVVSATGSVVPTTLAGAPPTQESETFPVRTFRVVEKPGKYTEIVVDKTAKVVSRGILIKTSSKDFVRTVEVRGSHSSGESYVVRMDGLIADIGSPLPVRQLRVFYPLNNFRYLYVRILSENKPLLKIEGIECFPPHLGDPLSKPLITRTIENRTDPANGVTVAVVDLGEHRLPPTSLSIGTGAREFIKKAALSGAASETSETWEKIQEGVMFRIRRNDAVAEQLTAAVAPNPFRFIKLELSGGSRGAVTVDKIQPVGTARLVVFDKLPGEVYKLYYDNPAAKTPAPGGASPASLDIRSLARLSLEIKLGPEQKNVAPPKSLQPVAKPVTEATPSSFGKWLGIAMLLMGLLLLFSIMLRALSVRRSSRSRRPSPTINSKI